MAISEPAAAVSMPTLYIPHGAGPCFFMDWNPPDAWNRMGDFLRNVAQTMPAPRAIVLVSAHWLAHEFSVTSGARPELIYDYSGFPPHTYELRYGAPGSPRTGGAHQPTCWGRRRSRRAPSRLAVSTMACSFRCC